MRRVTNRIRPLREALRQRFGDEYSVAACARRAGISDRAWRYYETGSREPSVIVAQAIADVLGVSVESLQFRLAEV